MAAPSRTERVRGCLLGGGVGDALGAPVEFLSRAALLARFGRLGVTGFEEAFGRRGAITDDTQMTLFTAEGLIRALRQRDESGDVDIPAALHRAYLRWHDTQRGGPGDDDSGWLVHQEVLHARREPGGNTMRALGAGELGLVDRRHNTGKGCGGVMRVAPVGLLDLGDPFTIGCDAAAVTHGHPTGFVAAGAMAVMVRRLLDGATMRDAVHAGRAAAAAHDEGDEVVVALDEAIELARRGLTPEGVAEIGEGWIAEEALGIAAACALSSTDFMTGVLMAVNHGGDSDSTGAITGNLLGAALGVGAIPTSLLDQLEARDLITQVADDLLAADAGTLRDDERYPPW